jgi:hypothetical protein
VNWSIVMVENSITWPKFRPVPTHVTVSVSEFSCSRSSDFYTFECATFRTFSTFSSVL